MDRSDYALVEEYLLQMRERDGVEWRPSTVAANRSHLRALVDYFTTELGGVRLVKAKPKHYAKWARSIRALRRPRPGGTTERTAAGRAVMLTAARRFNRWIVVDLELRKDDPTRKLGRPKVPTRKRRPMSDADADFALRCAAADPVMFAWLALILCCGVRVCELAWATVGSVQIDRDGSALWYVLGKRNKERIVPISPDVLNVVRPFLRGRRPRDPLFPRPSDGGHHTPGRVSHLIGDYLKSIDVRSSAHPGRHRFSTDYHERDGDLFRQAELLGHDSLNDTRHYTHLSPKGALAPLTELSTYRLAGVRTRTERPTKAAS